MRQKNRFEWQKVFRFAKQDNNWIFCRKDWFLFELNWMHRGLKMQILRDENKFLQPRLNVCSQMDCLDGPLSKCLSAFLFLSLKWNCTLCFLSLILRFYFRRLLHYQLICSCVPFLPDLLIVSSFLVYLLLSSILFLDFVHLSSFSFPFSMIFLHLFLLLRYLCF